MPGGYLDTSERGLRAMTDSDFYDLLNRANVEFSRRDILRNCKEEVDKRIDLYEHAASPEAKDIKTLQPDAMVGPGERIIVTGKYYKNVSRAWLSPFKAGPVNFAAGWEEQQGGVA